MPVDPQITMGKFANGMSYYIRANKKPEKRAELRLVVKAGSILRTTISKDSRTWSSTWRLMERNISEERHHLVPRVNWHALWRGRKCVHEF